MKNNHKNAGTGPAPRLTKGNKVWLIKGTSRGFGRIWTEAVLMRGAWVAATARELDGIADFKEKYEKRCP